MDELFKVVNGNQKESTEWDYRVSFSYLEIYQEKVKYIPYFCATIKVHQYVDSNCYLTYCSLYLLCVHFIRN